MTIGESADADHRYVMGSSCMHCTKSRSDLDGCHNSFLIGECCSKTVRGLRLVRSQIQVAVGAASSLVAIKVPSTLKATMDMPVLTIGSEDEAGSSGGVIGCAATL